MLTAHLVADNESLQNCAVKLKCLEIISDVLKAPPRVSQPYQTPSSLKESARIQEVRHFSRLALSSLKRPLPKPRAVSYPSPSSLPRVTPIGTKSS